MRATLKSRVLHSCAGLALAAALAGCASPAQSGDAVLNAGVSAEQTGAGGALSIAVLSSRPEFVWGGDARVAVRLASGGPVPRGLRVTADGRDVTNQLLFGMNDLEGVITGLKAGANALRVEAETGETSAELVVINHPGTGPILSGPHLTPYECRTVESGLGEATDRNCSAPTRYDWFYRTTDGKYKTIDEAVLVREFKDGQGKAPPDADTHQAYGLTLPVTVRVESGVINRSIYRIAIPKIPGALVRPLPPAAFDRDLRPTLESLPREWNLRLAVTFGGGAGTQYNQGTNQVTSVLNDLYLSRGFAYMNSTELVNQQHGNAVLQGETLMMLKEHFIEAYGVPKWTVGTGGSGGAIQQMVITQMYPGLLDGLQPSLAFPDSTMNTADCGLLQQFWKSAEGKKWSQEKKTAVEGYTPGTCSSWERSFVPVMMATNAPGCALNDKSLIYDPKTNPKGARCTITDMRANIYGRDPKTGFAKKPQDNVGVQYGLKGLNDGALTVDEFLQVNEAVGGNDIDGNFVKARSAGDPDALKAVYESGLINTFGGGIPNVPILNYRTYTDTTEPGDIHDRHRDLTIRARIEKANGRSDNQVIWVAPRAASRTEAAPVDVAKLALHEMTIWLDAMAADPAPLSTDKVVKHKPAGAVDAWFDASGKKTVEVASWDKPDGYNKTFPVHLEPRLIAGAPVTNDVMKCQLKPISFSDYKITFSPAQQTRMKAIFPDGVCDWSKPSVGYSMIRATYQTY